MSSLAISLVTLATLDMRFTAPCICCSCSLLFCYRANSILEELKLLLASELLIYSINLSVQSRFQYFLYLCNKQKTIAYE